MTTPTDVFLPTIEQPLGGPTPYLFAAHGPDEQLAALIELDRWVVWLVARYRLDHRTVPPCWASHGEVIEELSALRQAWAVAYASLGSADGPLTWHERFAHARARLVDWVARTGCGQEHRA